MKRGSNPPKYAMLLVCWNWLRSLIAGDGFLCRHDELCSVFVCYFLLTPEYAKPLSKKHKIIWY
ncbi:MAG: hypothetical protein B6I20_03180 [Bacteroidetes bacterium 4572_117]|nr:MAG: hypothetical protein B6I20_03180 [Bacteroidetes bacterium 4572_117]